MVKQALDTIRAYTDSSSAFEDLKVRSLLPDIRVYVDPVTKVMHLTKECVSIALPEMLNFLDVSLPRCIMCSRTPDLTFLKKVVSEVNLFRTMIEQLDAAEDTLVAAEGDLYVTARELGFVLTSLRSFPEYCATIEEGQYFCPLVQEIRLAAESKLVRLLTFLHSEKARAVAGYTYFPIKRPWPDGLNALLVSCETVKEQDIALLEIFGKEILPGKYLIAEREVEKHLVANQREGMNYLSGEGLYSVFHLPDDTSIEVILTMVALWDPGSTDAMGDASKALAAAQELTPK